MKNNKINKKGLLISAILLLILFSGYGIYLFSSKVVDDKKIDVTEKFLMDKKYHDLVFTDIKVFQLNKYIHLNFEIKNNSDYEFKGKNLKLVFLEKNGNTIHKEDLYVPTIKSQGVSRIDMTIEKKLSNSYNFLLSDE